MKVMTETSKTEQCVFCGYYPTKHPTGLCGHCRPPLGPPWAMDYARKPRKKAKAKK